MTTPNCQPASNLAKPAVLVVGEVKSAIQPPAAGLTALPRSPLINLVKINKGNTKAKGKRRFCAEIKIAANDAIEKAKPIMPNKKIEPLPNLSLNLPQNGLNIIQAKAEIEKIKPTSNSLNPKLLTSDGINMKTVDCPAPTQANAAERSQIDLCGFSCSLIISQNDRKTFVCI